MYRWLCIGGTNTSLFSENNSYRTQINYGTKNRRSLVSNEELFGTEKGGGVGGGQTLR